MRHRTLAAAVLTVALFLAASGAVSAQEIDRQITFEEEVVAGEPTNVTYTAVIQESPVETTAQTELTLYVDDEEVEVLEKEDEIFEGSELTTVFNHTFEESGERTVRVDSYAEVLGQEVEGTTEATVEVQAPEMEEEDDSEEMDGNDTAEMEPAGNESTSEDGEDEDGGGEGLPGFTALAAMLATTAFALNVRRKRQM